MKRRNFLAMLGLAPLGVLAAKYLPAPPARPKWLNGYMGNIYSCRVIKTDKYGGWVDISHTPAGGDLVGHTMQHMAREMAETMDRQVRQHLPRS